MTPEDPIAQLVTLLIERRPPPLAWIGRWGLGGVDPVNAAWAKAESPGDMLWLVRATMSPELTKHATVAVELVPTPDLNMQDAGWTDAWAAWRAKAAAAIRRVIPHVPTLDVVLRATCPR